jgi:tetratricopeptide (TPR) repeat protein
MSVINKMLRDLDSRQAAGPRAVLDPDARTGLARGTSVVATGSQRSRAKLPGLVLAALLLAAGLSLAGWWLLKPGASTPLAATAPSAPVAAPVAALAPVGKPPAAPAPAKADTAAQGMPPRAASPPQALAAPAPPPPASAQTTAKVQAPVSVANNAAPATAASSAAMVPSSSPAAPAPAQEALAQAQSMWNAGARDAAVDLLREALALAERSAAAGATGKGTLAALARELARMEVAQGRVGEALAMLARLEPALVGVADVWALRGNAAQRLGRHEESAAAYRMALQLRPNEARWMLGAAVSLAALGQTAAAAELAEKARAGGALSPEVAGYLRQLGVLLPER